MGGTVAYMRVSSRAQDVATQRSAVERAAAGRGDTIEVWFSEKKSGKTVARPELDRLRAEVRAGRIGKLYLFKLDRLTRSGIPDNFEVIQELPPPRPPPRARGGGGQARGPAATSIPGRLRAPPCPS